MVLQTRYAIESLKACGFTRSEFRVRCERRSNGEYGDVSITVFAPIARQIDALSALEKEFKVCALRMDGSIRHITIEEAHGHPGLTYQDVA